MKNLFFNILRFLSAADGEHVVSPLYDGITAIGPYAISVCALLGSVWGVFLGVKYAKAEDPAEKENLHKVLVNFCIGFITVLFLIGLIYGLRGSLVALVESE